MIRTFNFLRRYALTHPLYTFAYAIAFNLPGFAFNVRLYSKNELQNKLKAGKSLIRLGDGEINLLIGRPNPYQEHSSKAAAMIKEVIRNYSSESPYVLAIPRYVNIRNSELHRINRFNVWLPLKVMFLLMFPKKVPYLDAHCFYYDQYFETVVAPLLERKTILLVTNKEVIDYHLKNKNLPWEDIRYVEAPTENALIAYKEIEKNTNQALESLDPKETVLLVALGPIGKHLIFEYAKRGYQGIDIGKVAEVMFTGESIEYLI